MNISQGVTGTQYFKFRFTSPSRPKNADLNSFYLVQSPESSLKFDYMMTTDKNFCRRTIILNTRTLAEMSSIIKYRL